MGRNNHQAGAIAYRVRSGIIEIALVTASRSKRWVIPKGSITRGERGREAALREAEEEAGLRGRVERKPIGSYHYFKRCERCRVDVYLLRVTRVLERWPEYELRRRRWLAADKAAARIQVPRLRKLVLAAEQIVRTR